MIYALSHDSLAVLSPGGTWGDSHFVSVRANGTVLEGALSVVKTIGYSFQQLFNCDVEDLVLHS